MPKVLNKYTATMEELANAVYCGRGSPWGNPYKMGPNSSRDFVCDQYEKNVLPTLDINPLRGKDLWCFCAPKRCHCDVLLEKANA